jgi:hypothetical protein
MVVRCWDLDFRAAAQGYWHYDHEPGTSLPCPASGAAEEQHLQASPWTGFCMCLLFIIFLFLFFFFAFL